MYKMYCFAALLFGRKYTVLYRGNASTTSDMMRRNTNRTEDVCMHASKCVRMFSCNSSVPGWLFTDF